MENTMTINGKQTFLHGNTEKAICVLMTGITSSTGGSTISFKQWIPKSVIKEGVVAGWFMEKTKKEKYLMSIFITPILN